MIPFINKYIKKDFLREINYLLRYGISGLFISIFDFILFSIIFFIIKNINISFSINYLIVITFAFYTHGKFTFKKSNLKFLYGLKFIITNVLSYFIGLILIKFFYSLFSDAHLSKLLQIISCACFNLLIYRFFVFKEK